MLIAKTPALMIILSIYALIRCFVVFFGVTTCLQLASSTSISDILSFQKREKGCCIVRYMYKKNAKGGI